MPSLGQFEDGGGGKKVWKFHCRKSSNFENYLMAYPRRSPVYMHVDVSLRRDNSLMR